MKLSGLKSFVSPWTLLFPSDLVGIVGPNGSGKSNVIDAIRFVIGKSKARDLRGESISDVIFSGSTERKPLGQASVETIFDNSDKKLGGGILKLIQKSPLNASSLEKGNPIIT